MIWICSVKNEVLEWLTHWHYKAISLEAWTSVNFNFKYVFDKKIIDKYIGANSAHQPCGIIYNFVAEREKEFERLFDVVDLAPIDAPATSAVNRYAVVKGKSTIGDNVLVAQRAFLENATMGDGSNAQENSYIINSQLAGHVITAHGAKIINSEVGYETFVGFNSFLNGKENGKITIGANCIIVPHTVIDSNEPINIPNNYLVWGFIGSMDDLKNQSISFDDFEEARDLLNVGQMTFSGKTSVFLHAFQKRIHQVLLLNGALFKDNENRGHAQDDQDISFNTLQPYRTGSSKGIYPSIRINP